MKLTNKIWTDDELDYLENNYAFTTAKKIAIVLRRTRESVKSKAALMGIRSNFKFGQRIYQFNQEFFSTPNNMNSFYAGFSAADACMHFNISNKT